MGGSLLYFGCRDRDLIIDSQSDTVEARRVRFLDLQSRQGSDAYIIKEGSQ